MAGKRDIEAQETEVKRLTDAVRDLRMAALAAADPEQAARLGVAFKLMRERAEGAALGLEKLKDQREQLSALGKALADFRAASPAGKIGMAAAGAGAAVGAAGQLPGAALMGMARAAGAATAVITGMAGAVARFVEASNPGLMLQFNIALRDLMAAFGRILEPVIETLRLFANTLNEFVTSLQPVLGPVVKQLADAFLEIARAVLDAVAPVVELLIPVFKFLADIVLPPVVAVLRALGDAIRAVINWIRSWVGLSPLGRASEAGGPRTAAAMQARQVGISQLGEQARASAFGGQSVAVQQLAAQRQQVDLQFRTLMSMQRIENGLAVGLRPGVSQEQYRAAYRRWLDANRAIQMGGA